MFATWFEEASHRSFGTLFGIVLGGVLGWCWGRWKRHKDWVRILAGDARDTVVIQHHLIERHGDQATLRIRSVGQSQLDQVVPNGHLAGVLLRRAFAVTPTDTLINMTGPEGSYLLETLTGFVGDRLGHGSFQHDCYVMAPCCEPAELSTHQPIAILLIAVRDLELFATWPTARSVRVEHGSDGSRILTLMAMAKRFQHEQEQIAMLRVEGKRTTHIETMYILDLALDRGHAPLPTKPVPWGRFEGILKKLGLE